MEIEDTIIENLLENIKIKRGTLVDVGAFFTDRIKTFLENNWKVIAFEPNPFYFKKLKNTYAKNKNFLVINKAISDKEKQENFYISQKHPGISSLKKFHPTHKKAFKIKTCRLDKELERLNVKKVDYLKIDTEGADFLVLKSFNFQKYSPKIVMVEFMDSRTVLHFGYSFREMINYMRELDYEPYISEWSKIKDYQIKGKKSEHRFLKFYKYSKNIKHNPSWGNIIFIQKKHSKIFEKNLKSYIYIIKEKNKEINKLKQEINFLRDSKSWKITKPLRVIDRIFGKFFSRF